MTLTLGPMTFVYELDLYPVKLYSQTTNELSTLRLSTDIVFRQTGIQTDAAEDITTPRRADGNKVLTRDTWSHRLTALHTPLAEKGREGKVKLSLIHI